MAPRTLAHAMKQISPAERRALRARAHALHPVVSIAGKGLTDTVLGEIDRSLTAHELVKVRVYGAERAQREAFLEAICGTLEAAPVQHIGNILVVYRERPPEPVRAPVRTRAAGATPRRAAASVKPAATRSPRRR